MSPTSKEVFTQMVTEAKKRYASDDKVKDLLQEAASAKDINAGLERADLARQRAELGQKLDLLQNSLDPLSSLLEEYGLADEDLGEFIGHGEIFASGKDKEPKGEVKVESDRGKVLSFLKEVVAKKGSGFKHNDMDSLFEEMERVYGKESINKKSISTQRTKFKSQIIKLSNKMALDAKNGRKDKNGNYIKPAKNLSDVLNFMGIQKFNGKRQSEKPNDPLDNIASIDWRNFYKNLRKEYGSYGLEDFFRKVLYRKNIGGRPEGVLMYDSSIILKMIKDNPRAEMMLCNAIHNTYQNLKEKIFAGEDPIEVARRHHFNRKFEQPEDFRNANREHADKYYQQLNHEEAVSIIRKGVWAMAKNRKGLNSLKKFDYPAWEIVYAWMGELGNDKVKVEDLLHTLFPGVEGSVNL